MSGLKPSVFIYDDRGMLESFYDADVSSGTIPLMASKGRKTAAIICPFPAQELYYERIGTLEALSGINTSYLSEDPGAPYLYALYDYGTGAEITNEITLQPILSRVEIRYFTVDFSSEPYSGSSLTGAKAYLIDISGSHGILGGSTPEVEMLNSGEFDYYSLSRFKHPEMVYSNHVEGAVLYCYPSSCAKLVIEGIIDGNTYYYPIDLNSAGHLECGGNYVYDIFIKKKGVTDPETIADPQTIIFEINKKPWDEKEGQHERF